MTTNLFIVHYLDYLLLADPDWRETDEPAVAAVFAVGEEDEALAAARKQFGSGIPMDDLTFCPLPSNLTRE